MKENRILPGMELVPNLFPLTINTASVSVTVNITTKFKLCVVTHIFNDDDDPTVQLINLSGYLGSYRLKDFHAPTATERAVCFFFSRLRVIREWVWSFQGESSKAAAP